MLPFVAVISSGPSGRRDGMMEKCITEMAEGDKDELARLYEATHVAAYGFALSILKNTQDGVELDKDDGIMIYEVQFETETKKYEYDIHAVTGAVLSFEQKTKNTSGGTSSGTSSGASSNFSSGTQTEYIGEAAAKAAALAHANVSESQTKYIKCYYDYDHGQPVCYCVEFAVGDTRYEYEIDLYSGAVLEYEIDPHHS